MMAHPSGTGDLLFLKLALKYGNWLSLSNLTLDNPARES
jgi:hypothetical protein